MKVGIVSGDSEIGAALKDYHVSRGDEVWCTTRKRGSTDPYFDASDKNHWPYPELNIDRLYYLIALHERGTKREDVMNVNALWSTEALGWFAKNMKIGSELVVFTSHLGSIAHCNNSRAWVYRMSKAALNMGIRCMANFYTDQKWLLYHPGVVKTKLIGDRWDTFKGEIFTTYEAAKTCIENVNAWSKGPRNLEFLSYNGEQIPW